MTNFSATEFDCFRYFEYSIIYCDNTFIAFLTTHSSIEWCFFYEYCSVFTSCDSFYKLCFCSKNSHFGISSQFIITNKFCSNSCINFIINSCICTHVVCCLTCITGLNSLFFHVCFKSCFVNIESFFFKDFFC